MSGFRPGQGEAVAALESGRDVLVLLPTGAGKSLCYQLPAARAAGRVTIVVSPLIALMDDQVAALRARGIPAWALHSGRPWRDQADDRAHIAARGGLVYVSPERAVGRSFAAWVARLPVAYVAIDEAHCISEWGHDFRPEYRQLHALRSLGAPLIALTATATPRVVDEIRAALRLVDPTVVRGDVRRPNLALSVEHLRGDAARAERTVALVRGVGRAIVYASTRKRVKSLHDALRAAGIDAGYYHAGRSDGARESAARAYEEGRRPVLVATSAFGMGVDHPDVRVVVHAEAPGTLEAYWQQAGRAGRDGAPARCVLLWSPKDAVTQARLRGPTPGAKQGWEALEGYAFGVGCRQQAVARWFQPDAPGGPCGRCDACTREGDVAVAAATARMDDADRRRANAARRARDAAAVVDDAGLDAIVAFVDAMTRPLGRRQVALGLRGSRTVKKLAKNPEYGSLRGVPEAAIVRAIDALLRDGRLAPRGKKRPTVWIPGKAVRSADGPKAPRRAKFADPLAAALQRLRQREARRLKWKAYMVFDNATLAAIAKARPASLAALEAVPGMGPRRVAKLGAAILDVVASSA